jgi:hypothetical protein
MGLKFEARNPNFETIPNDLKSKLFSSFGVFEPLFFEFVSDFEFSISSKILGSAYPYAGGQNIGRRLSLPC